MPTASQSAPLPPPAPVIVNITVAPGRYWATAFADRADDMALYFQTLNELQGVLPHVEVTEAIDSTSDHPAGSFFLFTFPKPVQWPASLFGKPTVAGPGIHSLADTVQRPDPPPSAIDQAQGILDGISSGLETAFEIGAAALLVFALSKMVGGRK